MNSGGGVGDKVWGLPLGPQERREVQVPGLPKAGFCLPVTKDGTHAALSSFCRT